MAPPAGSGVLAKSRLAVYSASRFVAFRFGAARFVVDRVRAGALVFFVATPPVYPKPIGCDTCVTVIQHGDG